ncbi:MAG TPA: PAS domain S-box protein, partial [Planctomycetota bacterium]|nr:PAS domain S-box protein [Planctomycetota bacterium]
LGDAGSALVIAPVLILWLRDPRIRPNPRQILEGVLIAIAFGAVGVLVFGVPFRLGSRTFPLPGTLPLLAWAGFRLGRRGTAGAVLALSALAIWGTLEGRGSFAQRASSGEESLLFLQIFLAVSSATALAVAASVHERKEAERSLALLAAAVESSVDAILVVSPEGTILRWNRAAERLYGYSEEEARGKPISILIPDARRLQEQALLSRVVQGERIDHYETVRQRKSGSLVDVSLTISPVKNREGQIIAVSKTAREVTEQKRVQKEILRLNAELELRVQERTARLEAAVRELESFTYSVAHDLRAPLRGMHQFCELLLEEKSDLLDPEARGWIRRVVESSERMDTLIESLLAYSRIGRQDLVLSAQDLSRIVPEILESMKSEIHDRQATVTVDPGLPRVLGHPVPLTQCLTNLLSNATKFVPASRKPLVRVSADRKEGVVRVVVEDNGIGIDERHRDRLFQIFHRLHNTEEYPGTGIGLAIVKKAAGQMHGSVGFESAPGQGTRFYFDLPGA